MMVSINAEPAPRSSRNRLNCSLANLVVHPLSCSDIWYGGDPGAARGEVPPSTTPEERVLVRVPVRGGAPDGLFDLRPSLKAAALQRQRAQDLPPRLDQVQVGRVLGLEDELPTRVSEVLLDEGLKWRQEETWFGARVDPEFERKRSHGRRTAGLVKSGGPHLLPTRETAHARPRRSYPE